MQLSPMLQLDRSHEEQGFWVLQNVRKKEHCSPPEGNQHAEQRVCRIRHGQPQHAVYRLLPSSRASSVRLPLHKGSTV